MKKEKIINTAVSSAVLSISGYMLKGGLKILKNYWKLKNMNF